MKSTVYAITMRASHKENMPDKLSRLLDALDLGRGIKAHELVALKVHFGEKGNTSYVRPVYVRRVVDAVTALGAHPFLTDANPLYVGTRTNSAEPLKTAIENGFAYAVVGAPLTIADGLKGSVSVEVPIDGKHFQSAFIAADIVEADAIVSIAHFKLHELAGFGGAMKNIGMGGAARRGKMAQHSDVSPKVVSKKCIGCAECEPHCAQGAITVEKREDGKKKARIDREKCVGCAECIPICLQKAIDIHWDMDLPRFQEKMVEYTKAALTGKEKKSFFINFLTQITPSCDCHPFADAPIVRDIGVLASDDPVALDQASVDLMNRECGLNGCRLETGLAPGDDKIKAIYPQIDWTVQFAYAQEIGLGSREYELQWLRDKI